MARTTGMFPFVATGQATAHATPRAAAANSTEKSLRHGSTGGPRLRARPHGQRMATPGATGATPLPESGLDALASGLVSLQPGQAEFLPGSASLGWDDSAASSASVAASRSRAYP